MQCYSFTLKIGKLNLPRNLIIQFFIPEWVECLRFPVFCTLTRLIGRAWTYLLTFRCQLVCLNLFRDCWIRSSNVSVNVWTNVLSKLWVFSLNSCKASFLYCSAATSTVPSSLYSPQLNCKENKGLIVNVRWWWYGVCAKMWKLHFIT